MPAEKVVRFYDYERRSREPDAAGPRDPTEAVVIKLEPRHIVTDVCGCERCRREFNT